MSRPAKNNFSRPQRPCFLGGQAGLSWLLGFFTAALLCALSFKLYVYWFGPRIVGQNGENKATSTAFVYFSKLDGQGVKTAAEVNPRVVGVMVDNHPEAWPQRGLEKARVVYEAPAEGGITRFLAIFDEFQTVEKVGPVRSARPYFIDWLREYGDGLYMHCGGSPAALTLIENADIFSANEYYRGSYYWRDEARSAPHNLYTDSKLWQKFISKFGGSRPVKNFESWKFIGADEADLPALPAAKPLQAGKIAGEPVRKIKIKYNPDYAVEWVFVKDSMDNIEDGGRYERWQNGTQMLNGGVPITAANVVVQSVEVEILDEIGRRAIETTGGGEARVLQSGKLIRGSWQRENLDSRTRFYDKNNKEIGLLAGTTWVEVIPNRTEIEVSN